MELNRQQGLDLKDIINERKRKYVFELDKARKAYNDEKILEATNVSEMSWKIINKERESKERKELDTINLRQGSIINSDPTRVANLMNDYYISLPETIIENTNEANELPRPMLNSMFLGPIHEEDVKKSI